MNSDLNTALPTTPETPEGGEGEKALKGKTFVVWDNARYPNLIRALLEMQGERGEEMNVQTVKGEEKEGYRIEGTMDLLEVPEVRLALATDNALYGKKGKHKQKMSPEEWKNHLKKQGQKKKAKRKQASKSRKANRKR